MFICSQQLIYNIPLVVTLVASLHTSKQSMQVFPSHSTVLNIFIFYVRSLICRPTKIPSLVFASPILGKFFIEPNLIWRGGRQIFLGSTTWAFITFSPRVRDLRKDHIFFLKWLIWFLLSHSHKKQQNVVYPVCKTSNIANTLRSPHMFQLNFSYILCLE